MYNFIENFKPLSIKKIEKIEKKLNIQLPQSYKIFISQCNNANFIFKHHFAYKKGRGYSNSNKRNFEDSEIGLDKFINFEKIIKEIYLINNDFRQVNLQEIIPIVEEWGHENYFFIYVKEGKNYGKVYFSNEMSDFTFETLYYMAENFEEFLSCIIDDKTYREINDL